MTTPMLPDAIRRDLTRAGLGAQLLGPDDLDQLPAIAGAYALLLKLGKEVLVERPRDAAGNLPPGWYVYAGSARGPGGIRARLTRHFRAEKRPHWHIDQLTGACGVDLWASPAPAVRECDLVAKMTGSEFFSTALPGFGSTDCGKCEAHLLVWRAKA